MVEPCGKKAWLLVDGLPFWLLNTALDRHPELLPTLSLLKDKQRLQGFQPVSPNCQTPPSLATLFSGLPSSKTHITGFELPDFRSLPSLGVRRAFEAYDRTVEFIWDRCARRGEEVRLTHVPFVNTPGVGKQLKSYFYGYDGCVKRAGVLTRPEAEMLIGTEAERLSSEHWSIVRLKREQTLGDSIPMALARRSATEPDRILFSGAWLQQHLNTPHAPKTPFPFIGNGIEQLYRDGSFGRTLVDGGSGDAEFVFFDALRLVTKHFTSCWLNEFSEATSGLVISYLPSLDLFLHELIGFLAPDCDHWTQQREAIIFPLFMKFLVDLDLVLARTLEAQAPCDRVLVSSDHGMTPIDLIVRPNVLLAANGYLKRTEEGDIDVSQSMMFYHPAENGLICFNSEVCEARGRDIPTLCDELLTNLGSLTGRKPELFAREDIESVLSPPQWLTARHFLSAGRYVQAKADFSGPPIEPSRKTGEHVVTTNEHKLLGTVMDLSQGTGPIYGIIDPEELCALLLR